MGGLTLLLCLAMPALCLAYPVGAVDQYPWVRMSENSPVVADASTPYASTPPVYVVSAHSPSTVPPNQSVPPPPEVAVPPTVAVPPVRVVPPAEAAAPLTAAAAPARAVPPTAAASSPRAVQCWVRDDASQPFQSCKVSTFPSICQNGSSYPTEEACCAQNAAYSDGCREPPAQCWVPESNETRTCVMSLTCMNPNNDPSKIFASEDVCCSRNVVWPEGCSETQAEARAKAGGVPCWVRGTFYPAKRCRSSYALCQKDTTGTGIYPTEADCCAPGGAFSDGCDHPLPTTCWIVDEYDPRSCRHESRAYVCLRGWGTYDSNAACCAGAFGTQGCQVEPA